MMYVMQRPANGYANAQKAKRRLSQRRNRSRPRDNRPADATYRDPVATSSPDVIRKRFAAFVARTLAAARDRGMTDSTIRDATGIPPSTFHRWQKGQFTTAPSIDKVRQFCEGLGASVTEAMAALGMTPQRAQPQPEPPLPPEVRTILRKLADPNVPQADKLVMREMLLMLAERAERLGRKDRGGEGREAV